MVRCIKLSFSALSSLGYRDESDENQMKKLTEKLHVKIFLLGGATNK